MSFQHEGESPAMAVNFKHKRAYTAAERDLVMKVIEMLRGMSNSEAARECGLVNSTVSKWRTRRTRVPSMKSALKVAVAFGLNIAFVEADEKRHERRTHQPERRTLN
jgi:transcriptional regulator with XRE-family HTH domain